MAKYMKAADAVELFLGRRVNPTNVWRWCKFGLQGRKLRTIKVGTRYECTVDDVRDFFEREHESEAGSADTPTARKRQQATIERQLQAELA